MLRRRRCVAVQFWIVLIISLLARTSPAQSSCSITNVSPPSCRVATCVGPTTIGSSVSISSSASITAISIERCTFTGTFQVSSLSVLQTINITASTFRSAVTISLTSNLRFFASSMTVTSSSLTFADAGIDESATNVSLSIDGATLSSAMQFSVTSFASSTLTVNRSTLNRFNFANSLTLENASLSFWSSTFQNGGSTSPSISLISSAIQFAGCTFQQGFLTTNTLSLVQNSSFVVLKSTMFRSSYVPSPYVLATTQRTTIAGYSAIVYSNNVATKRASIPLSGGSVAKDGNSAIASIFYETDQDTTLTSSYCGRPLSLKGVSGDETSWIAITRNSWCSNSGQQISFTNAGAAFQVYSSYNLYTGSVPVDVSPRKNLVSYCDNETTYSSSRLVQYLPSNQVYDSCGSSPLLNASCFPSYTNGWSRDGTCNCAAGTVPPFCLAVYSVPNGVESAEVTGGSPTSTASFSAEATATAASATATNQSSLSATRTGATALATVSRTTTAAFTTSASHSIVDSVTRTTSGGASAALTSSATSSGSLLAASASVSQTVTQATTMSAVPSSLSKSHAVSDSLRLRATTSPRVPPSTSVTVTVSSTSPSRSASLSQVSGSPSRSSSRSHTPQGSMTPTIRKTETYCEGSVLGLGSSLPLLEPVTVNPGAFVSVRSSTAPSGNETALSSKFVFRFNATFRTLYSVRGVANDAAPLTPNNTQIGDKTRADLNFIQVHGLLNVRESPWPCIVLSGYATAASALALNTSETRILLSADGEKAPSPTTNSSHRVLFSNALVWWNATSGVLRLSAEFPVVPAVNSFLRIAVPSTHFLPALCDTGWIPLGVVHVVEPPPTATEAATSATTATVAAVGSSVQVVSSSLSSASDLQMLAVIGLMSCSSSRVRNSFGNYRTLSPTRLSDSFWGVLLGNLALLAAVAVAHFLAMLLFRFGVANRCCSQWDVLGDEGNNDEEPEDSPWGPALTASRYPAWTVGAMMALYPGTMFGAAQLAVGVYDAKDSAAVEPGMRAVAVVALLGFSSLPFVALRIAFCTPHSYHRFDFSAVEPNDDSGEGQDGRIPMAMRHEGDLNEAIGELEASLSANEQGGLSLPGKEVRDESLRSRHPSSPSHRPFRRTWFHRCFAPSGVILSQACARRLGPLVSSMRHRSTVWALLPFASSWLLTFATMFPVPTVERCAALFSLMFLIHVALVTAIAWCRPFRTPSRTVLAAFQLSLTALTLLLSALALFDVSLFPPSVVAAIGMLQSGLTVAGFGLGLLSLRLEAVFVGRSVPYVLAVAWGADPRQGNAAGDNGAVKWFDDLDAMEANQGGASVDDVELLLLSTPSADRKRDGSESANGERHPHDGQDNGDEDAYIVVPPVASQDPSSNCMAAALPLMASLRKRKTTMGPSDLELALRAQRVFDDVLDETRSDVDDEAASGDGDGVAERGSVTTATPPPPVVEDPDASSDSDSASLSQGGREMIHFHNPLSNSLST